MLDFFGKRKVIIWKLAACRSKPLILICKIEAYIAVNFCTAVGLPLFFLNMHRRGLFVRVFVLYMCVCLMVQKDDLFLYVLECNIYLQSFFLFILDTFCGNV